MPEPKFIPKPGQIDFSDARYAPVVNAVVRFKNEILLVKRSAELRLYPNYWNGISGFLDDKKSIEEKVAEELHEELGIGRRAVAGYHVGRPFLQEAQDYNKTWIVIPVRVEVLSKDFKLNWEAQEARWFRSSEIKKLQLLPGFDRVLQEVYGGKSD